MNLCIKCNKNNGYYHLNKILQITNNYKECIKKTEKPLNYCFNEENEDFRPCQDDILNSSNEDYIYKIDRSYIENENNYNGYIIDYIGCNINELLNNKCKLENNNKTIIANIQQNLREAIIRGYSDELINNMLNNRTDSYIIDSNSIKYEISLSNNNNKYKNITIIELGDCENILKNYYNISINEPLIIFKVDIYEEYSRIPIVEYEVYDLRNKSKLNLDLCQNTKIDLLIPVIIDEKNEYIYNLSSEYYNNLCHSSNRNNNKDTILEDRKKEYIDNNLSLCEQDCEYEGYDTNIKKSKCNCFIKLKMPIISEIEVNKDKLINNFINIKDITNMKIIFCYKELFSDEGLKINIGNYIILSIILINIACLVFYNIKDFKLLINLLYTFFGTKENKITENIEITRKNKDINQNKKKKSKNIKRIKKKHNTYNFNFIKLNEGSFEEKNLFQ